MTKPENVEPYIRAMLGPDIEFEREWYSVYTFQCQRIARFVHGRVVFAGDAAHLVSPFGARGCNGGFADIENLGWKLDFVLLARGWQGAFSKGVRLVEVGGVAADRLGLTEGAAALVRPDQYVAARWKTADPAAVEAALGRAKGGKPWLN